MNSILNNKVTKTSKTPGKTNFLQFLHLPLFDISLVDCPGYGFAKRSIKEKKEWNKMMEYYLTNHN
jgi:GTP-binding protein